MSLSRMGLLQRLSGYRPGRLLAQLRRNLADMEWETLEVARARLRPPDHDIQFEVHERPTTGLLMHTVTAEFLCTLAPALDSDAEITITHSGMARRTSVNFKVTRGEEAQLAPLLERLRSNPELTQSLMRLDFTSCRLRRSGGAWKFSLMHYGASEVAFLFPPYRRYIRLTKDQIDALLNASHALRSILG